MEQLIQQLANVKALVSITLALPLIVIGMAVWFLSVRRKAVAFQVAAADFGITKCKFILVQGRESNYFFNADRFLSQPKNVQMFALWFEDAIRELRTSGLHVNMLAFVEKTAGPVGVLTSKDLLSLRTGLPSVTVRPRRRLKAGAVTDRSAGRAVEHAGLLVSDVATTGRTMLDAVRVVRDSGVNVVAAAVLYDREEGALNDLKRAGIKLVSMLTYQQAIDTGIMDRAPFTDVEEKAVVA